MLQSIAYLDVVHVGNGFALPRLIYRRLRVFADQRWAGLRLACSTGLLQSTVWYAASRPVACRWLSFLHGQGVIDFSGHAVQVATPAASDLRL